MVRAAASSRIPAVHRGFIPVARRGSKADAVSGSGPEDKRNKPRMNGCLIRGRKTLFERTPCAPMPLLQERLHLVILTNPNTRTTLGGALPAVGPEGCFLYPEIGLHG